MYCSRVSGDLWSLVACFDEQEMIKANRLDPNSQVYKDLVTELEKDGKRRLNSKRNESYVALRKEFKLRKAALVEEMVQASTST